MSQQGSEAHTRAIEAAMLHQSIVRKVTLHVAPPLILLYFIAFLDRVNVSFAALTMNRDLGISNTTFGAAAGIFFLGYMLFAVPSNLVLDRVGARRWIAVLMVLWGVISGSMAFVHGPHMYVALRFLVGAAEAGFFPGVILYLTRWLPASARAGTMAMFTLSVPLSSVVGAPISAWLLRMNGAHGMRGWQWLFLMEAIPAVLVGLCVPFILPAGPREVKWLSEQQRDQLITAIEADDAAIDTTKPSRNRSVFAFPLFTQIAIACAIYFLYAIGLYELGFWVPRLLSARGVSITQLGWITAIPFAIGALGMYLWSRASDKTGERDINLTGAFLAGALGMAITAFGASATNAIAGLSIAAIGIFAGLPIFWAAFSQRTPVHHRAIGIATVNSIGNVGGFLGPYATGWLLDRTHSYASGLYATAACLALGGIVVFARGVKRKRTSSELS